MEVNEELENVKPLVPVEMPEDTGPDNTSVEPELEEPLAESDTNGQPTSMRERFYGLNLKEFDRDLTPKEAQEWNNIYASYRSKSVLSGMVIGRGQNTFNVSGDGENQVTTIRSLIIIDYRVKILIPETELWMPDSEKPRFVLPNMVGSTIDYCILEIDREGAAPSVLGTWLCAQSRCSSQDMSIPQAKSSYAG